MDTEPICVGDTVCIVRSPYVSVRNGTQTVVEYIYLNHFASGVHLYWMAGLPNRCFRRAEIQKLNTREN